MKKFYLLLLGIFCCTMASAGELRDYDFQQERMLLAEDGIYLISSFDTSDNVTAYNYYGDLLWDTSFYAKITSWQVAGSRIVVFSKNRSGHKTYLTCLDRYTGKVLWQRP